MGVLGMGDFGLRDLEIKDLEMGTCCGTCTTEIEVLVLNCSPQYAAQVTWNYSSHHPFCGSSCYLLLPS